jgi:capsule polysaccharide export protein KpsE/RkpR
LQSSQQLGEFLARVQAQLEALPEYRKLKAGAEAATENLAQAVQRVVAGCEGCQLDVKTLRLVRREASSRAAP